MRKNRLVSRLETISLLYFSFQNRNRFIDAILKIKTGKLKFSHSAKINFIALNSCIATLTLLFLIQVNTRRLYSLSYTFFLLEHLNFGWAWMCLFFYRISASDVLIDVLILKPNILRKKLHLFNSWNIFFLSAKKSNVYVTLQWHL